MARLTIEKYFLKNKKAIKLLKENYIKKTKKNKSIEI
jgi:hypothetical protein